MTFNDTFDFIVGKATNEELENLISAIKERRTILARRAKMNFRVGDNIKFTHRSVRYTGKITHIKDKKASITCSSPRVWSVLVPMNMLEAA